MPETPEAAGDAVALRAEQLGANFARLLARVLVASERALKPVLERAITGDVTATAQAAQGLTLRSDIRRALADAGFDDLMQTASAAAVESMATEVLKTPAAIGIAKMVKPSQSRIRALAALGEANLLGEAENITTALIQAVSVWTFTVVPPAQILDALAKVTDAEFAKIQTLFDTQVSIYGRQIEALATDNLGPSQAFIYTGPVDGRTREWCLSRVGKVFTRAEIAQMNNGQLDNAFLTGGGYNCRHMFMAVAAEDLRKLVGSNKRAEGYDRRIARAKELQQQANKTKQARRRKTTN